jgi:type II secretory pathway component GspD/PulD (secretin)
MKTAKNICWVVLLAALLALLSARADDTPTNSPADSVPEASTNAIAPTPAQSPDVSNQTPQPATNSESEKAGEGTSVEGNSSAGANSRLQVAGPAQDVNTNNATDFPPEKGLRFNFRGVRLEMVLNYLSTAAGFIIHLKPGVDVKGEVNAWSSQPLSKEEAVGLLKQALSENGYTAIQDGRTLTIVRTEESKKNYLPVKLGNVPANIPRNEDMVTQIIPVRTLNPVQLLKDIQPLLPSNTTITANESANSLVVTDTQANIRRIAEIVRALDSVSSSVNIIRVFPLKYADAKALASTVKELFPSQDSSRNNNGGNFGGFPGFPGGGPPGFGGNGGGNSSSDSGQSPNTRVAAVADDHGNSLVVSAPQELMSTIEQLVQSVDHNAEDVTQVRVFHLQNADPGEMADLLSSLFPDDSSSQTDASRQIQFGGPGGGPFGPFGGGRQGGNANASGDQSNRMKKMGKVIGVADRRTQSIVVTASKSLMPEIEAVIHQLDANPANKQHIYAVSLKNADPQDVANILQDLFPASSTSRNSSSANSSQTSPLATRSSTLLQQSLQSSQNSSLSLGSSSSGGRSGP